MCLRFFSSRYLEAIEDAIADVEQGANPSSFLQFGDNPDDEAQREVGRAIANSIGRQASPSPQLVIRIDEAGNPSDA